MLILMKIEILYLMKINKKLFKDIKYLIIKMQLSNYDHLTSENIIFNEAKEYKVKDSKIKYKRIPIEVK